jgi:hypothetical protein
VERAAGRRREILEWRFHSALFLALADPEFTFRGAAQMSGVRTMLGVPMLREGAPIGVINLQRIVTTDALTRPTSSP